LTTDVWDAEHREQYFSSGSWSIAAFKKASQKLWNEGNSSANYADADEAMIDAFVDRKFVPAVDDAGIDIIDDDVRCDICSALMFKGFVT
jgi:RNA-splicing ligase RtcB